MTLDRVGAIGLFLTAFLGGCGSSPEPTNGTQPSQDEGALRTTHASNDHEVFVCKTDDAQAKTVSMFAYDEDGEMGVGVPNGPGYCTFPLSSGMPFDRYWCWVGDTDTATTTDGQLAITFTKYLGDGLEDITQLNLPKDLREHRVGKGTMRSLGRAPRDLTQPIQRPDEHIECKLQSITFPPPP